jgi:hypothetical protein
MLKQVLLGDNTEQSLVWLRLVTGLDFNPMSWLFILHKVVEGPSQPSSSSGYPSQILNQKKNLPLSL